MTAVGGWQVNVDHLERSHFFDHCPWRQSWSQGVGVLLQSYLQAISHEGDKDMRFDAMLKLVIDGSD